MLAREGGTDTEEWVCEIETLERVTQPLTRYSPRPYLGNPLLGPQEGLPRVCSMVHIFQDCVADKEASANLHGEEGSLNQRQETWGLGCH